MEMVKTGYKQTEIGLIPEDWEVKSLIYNSDLITKGTTPHKFSNTGVNYIKIESFVNNKINIDKCLFVEGLIHNTFLKRSILKENDILFAIAGATIGKTAIVYNSILPANTNQALAIIRLNNQIDFKYVYSILKSNLMIEFIKENAIGGAQPNLNLQQIGAFQIPLPPLPEQQAIAEALSDADSWIESLEQLIAKKRLLKQGAMQDLLSPKEDWEVKKLGEVCNELVQGINTAIDKPEYSVEGIPILKANDVIDGKINLSDCDYITQKSFNSYNERFFIKKGDFLLSNIGARLGTGSIYNFDSPSTYAWNVMRISVNLKLLNQKYFSYYINSPSFNKIMLSNQSGSGMGFVPKFTLINFPIYFPILLSEQTRIATILSDMDLELEALQQQLEKARQIKQGMMQELLTGRIRLV